MKGYVKVKILPNEEENFLIPAETIFLSDNTIINRRDELRH